MRSLCLSLAKIVRITEQLFVLHHAGAEAAGIAGCWPLHKGLLRRKERIFNNTQGSMQLLLLNIHMAIGHDDGGDA